MRSVAPPSELPRGSSFTTPCDSATVRRTFRAPLGSSTSVSAATLIVWGRNDPLILPAAAEFVKRVVPAADLRYFDGGHFVLDEYAGPIADAIIETFSDRSESRRRRQSSADHSQLWRTSECDAITDGDLL